MLHVPFKGGADAGRALLSGEVQILFDAPVTAINNAKGGRVKMLLATSRQGPRTRRTRRLGGLTARVVSGSTWPQTHALYGCLSFLPRDPSRP